MNYSAIGHRYKQAILGGKQEILHFLNWIRTTKEASDQQRSFWFGLCHSVLGNRAIAAHYAQAVSFTELGPDYPKEYPTDLNVTNGPVTSSEEEKASLIELLDTMLRVESGIAGFPRVLLTPPLAKLAHAIVMILGTGLTDKRISAIRALISSAMSDCRLLGEGVPFDVIDLALTITLIDSSEHNENRILAIQALRAWESS